MLELYPLIERNEQDQIAGLGPLLRLLQTCNRQISGSVEDIDGLLGCPVSMFPRTLLDVRI